VVVLGISGRCRDQWSFLELVGVLQRYRSGGVIGISGRSRD
jgi:hypothetical protein